ncbi:LysR family transcriptional regulator [Cupriavidus oxalaticus]|uniref:LysR family transcriptional regulator n=1 Tax=Cupriavidus oxalaticus TaxID=96344 RepID=A0A4P7LTD2_9BURK|nr:LysR family transcriptional regulator [Cupriavidus oxalaticus]QBY55927.1 LysR family transcriptional regulator [Cupriavidus oxalaticus]
MHNDAFDCNLLAVFDAMLRERSVTRAAAQLGLTQSAMSHALNRLRDYFDDPLFVKTSNGMTPTIKAEALAETVLEVMTAIRTRVLPQASFDPASLQRTFTLCMTDMGELVFLPPLMKALRKVAPQCKLRTLQVPIPQIEALLAAGDADLVLGSVRTAPELLFQQQLFMHSFVTIVSQKNKLVRDILTLEQFETLPHICVSLAGRASPTYDADFERHGLKRNVYLHTPHFLTIPLLMEQEPELIATVPQELATVFCRYGIVRAVKPPVTLPPYALSQYWHPRFHHDPAIVWLRQLVKETFDQSREIEHS